MVTISTSAHGDVTVGTVLRWTTTYSDDDLREFCRLSGLPADPPPRHLPYLLVVAPLTKLGGDLNYLSARMDWTVTRPVLATEAVTAELEVTRLEPTDGMTKIAFDARLRCGEEIIGSGTSKGFVVT